MRYLVNTDGGSRGNPGPAGYGYVVRDNEGTVLYEKAGFLGTATNNVAEYTAVVDALATIAAADPNAHVTVRADSNLVVQQLSGAWKIKNADLRELALRAKRMLPASRVEYVWVPRAENAAADRLANLAMDRREDVERGALGTAPTAPSAEVETPVPAGREPARLMILAVGNEALRGVDGVVRSREAAVWAGPGTAVRATAAALAGPNEPEPLGARIENLAAEAAGRGGEVVVVVQTNLARQLLGSCLGIDPERIRIVAGTVSVLATAGDVCDVISMGVPLPEADLVLF